MALAANKTIVELFGTNAVIFGTGATAEIRVRITDLSTSIEASTAHQLEAEGILLAMLQFAYAAQGVDPARVLSLDRSAAAITTRGNVACRKETYSVSVYADDGIDILDPDLV